MFTKIIAYLKSIFTYTEEEVKKAEEIVSTEIQKVQEVKNEVKAKIKKVKASVTDTTETK